MNTSEIVAQYQQRKTQFEQAAQKIQQQVNQISWLRIVVFLGGVLVIYLFAQSGEYVFANLSAVVAFALFLYLVKVHAQRSTAQKHLTQLALINDQEADALQGNISHFEEGTEYRLPEHPYASDLDIFGKQSIFQWLNRTASRLGQDQLAQWLNTPEMDIKTIERHQEAIKDLKDRLEYRQHFQAYKALHHEKAEELQALLDWLQAPVSLPKQKIYSVILVLFPLITLLVGLAGVFALIEMRWIFVPMLVQLSIVSFHLQKLLSHSKEVSERAKFLQKYSQLFEIAEKQDFRQSHLKALQKQLTNGEITASQSLGKLARIIGNMEQGSSLMGLIFNGLFMWSLQYLYRLELWQDTQKEDLKHWFAALAQLDALQSLANLHYNYPDYTFPTLIDASEPFRLEAKQLGHPLLPANTRIGNPVSLTQEGQLLLITGANMAGKSTYLRTVGVNLLLGMMGAPVCAELMQFKPIEIYTSMRTQDSLQASESFFYAELKRLQMMVELLKAGKSLFIILDEILKGTNSADQHAGAKALIEQLTQRKAVGLVATHDLALGVLSEKYPEHIRNQCFEIEIINDELQFDYQLREGLSQNLNATFLMKKMGITD